MKTPLILALAVSTLLVPAVAAAQGNAPAKTAQSKTAQSKTAQSSAAPAKPGEVMGMANLGGTFKSLDAPTTGSVRIAKAGAGYTLKLSDFKTEPAPDLHIWLFSGVPTEAKGDLKKQPYLDLGTLKTDAKTASVAIPAGTDLSKYKSVVLWCDQFSVAFAAAELK